MSSVEQLISDYSDSINKHRTWLGRFDKWRLKRWEASLKASPETAICEASTRKLLSDHNVDVKPYEDRSKGGPDFLCSKDGKTFYVETTCIIIQAATRESGLDSSYNPDDEEGCAYEIMTEKIRTEIGNKTPQCSKVNAPCIVVIATLHFQAGECCFDFAAEDLLTGTTHITHDINNKTHEPVGDSYETTRLENSVFIRPKKDSPNWIEYCRNPISAVLLCGFGLNPPNVAGCLHPNPNHIFERTLLPNIHFAQLTSESLRTGYLTVEWI